MKHSQFPSSSLVRDFFFQKPTTCSASAIGAILGQPRHCRIALQCSMQNGLPTAFFFFPRALDWKRNLKRRRLASPKIEHPKTKKRVLLGKERKIIRYTYGPKSQAKTAANLQAFSCDVEMRFHAIAKGVFMRFRRHRLFRGVGPHRTSSAGPIPPPAPAPPARASSPPADHAT